MTICVDTISVSPHMMPLAEELSWLFDTENFRYVATDAPDDNRQTLGWGERSRGQKWILQPGINVEDQKSAEDWRRNADVLIGSNRDLNLFEHRARMGKITFYSSERWLKPPIGMLRLFFPRYFRIARRISRLFASPYFYYLPMGVFAVQDMRRIMTWVGSLSQEKIDDKMRMWGYFIDAGSDCPNEFYDDVPSNDCFRILWFGRFLNWKRVDLLLKAAASLRYRTGPALRVKLIGSGGEEARLRRLSERLGMMECVEFHAPIPITKIRGEIRRSDVCVVTSNGMEGWGVAVNEVLSEGRCLIAGDATGAGTTLVQDGVNGLLFENGNAIDLALRLQTVREDVGLRKTLAQKARLDMLANWTPAMAAVRFKNAVLQLLDSGNMPDWSGGVMSRVTRLTR